MTLTTDSLNSSASSSTSKPDESQVDDEDYFIPSLDDISTYSCATTSYSNAHSSYTNHPDPNPFISYSKYCTAKSLSTVQSIESEIDYLPLTFKNNIWIHDPNNDTRTVSTTIHQPSPPRNKPECLYFKSFKNQTYTVPKTSRFFIIKSYSILDINASFVHNLWTSTELGNKRLDKAYHEVQPQRGKIFLFFSVNASGKFCGIAEMIDKIDYTKTSNIWSEQTRWKGIFPVEWVSIKNVPNKYFQHLRIPSNENKSVTNSRDTQEVPFEVGVSMLKIITSFKVNINS